MKAKRFLSVVLILCLVLGLSSTSMAAKKKAPKKKAAGDAITQIVNKNKPENKTNAQTIRDVLKKYEQSHIFIITLTDDNWLVIEVVSAKNGASKGKAYLGIGEKYMDNSTPLWNKMKNACIFDYSGLALVFRDINEDGDFISVDDLFDAEELDKLLDNNNLYTEDYFPFILKYLETGI